MFWYIISNAFNFFWVFKDFFDKYGYNFYDVSKNDYFRLSVHDVTNNILTCHSNYVVVLVMWPKFGNSSISVREAIMTSILYGFDQKFRSILVWPWNLYQFGKRVKTINTSVVKGLKLKVRKFSGLILTFVEVTGEKLVGGPFCPTHPHLVHEYIWIINLWNFLVSNFSRN